MGSILSLALPSYLHTSAPHQCVTWSVCVEISCSTYGRASLLFSHVIGTAFPWQFVRKPAASLWFPFPWWVSVILSVESLVCGCMWGVETPSDLWGRQTSLLSPVTKPDKAGNGNRTDPQFLEPKLPWLLAFSFCTAILALLKTLSVLFRYTDTSLALTGSSSIPLQAVELNLQMTKSEYCGRVTRKTQDPPPLTQHCVSPTEWASEDSWLVSKTVSFERESQVELSIRKKQKYFMPQTFAYGGSVSGFSFHLVRHVLSCYFCHATYPGLLTHSFWAILLPLFCVLPPQGCWDYRCLLHRFQKPHYIDVVRIMQWVL